MDFSTASPSLTTTASPSASASPTLSPSPSGTASPSHAPSGSGSASPSHSPSPSKSPSNSTTASPSPSHSPSPSPSPTPSPSKSHTGTLCVTAQIIRHDSKAQPGGTITYSVWIWSTVAAQQVTAVAASNIHAMRTPQFTLCPAAHNTHCSVGALPSNQAFELEVTDQLRTTAVVGHQVTLTVTVQGAGLSPANATVTTIVGQPASPPGSPPPTPPVTTLPPSFFPSYPATTVTPSGLSACSPW